MIATAARPRRQRQPRNRPRPGTPGPLRAEVLLAAPIKYIPQPLFLEANARERIEQLRPKQPASCVGRPSARRDSIGLAALYSAPLLSADEERYLFCRMNFEKHRAAVLLDKLRRSPENPGLVEAITDHLGRAVALRNEIVEANLRLVPGIAKTFREPDLTLEELVSAGHLPLIRAAESFDVSRGLCFSTYATHAIRNHLLRLRAQRSRRARGEVPGDPELLSEAADPRPAIGATELHADACRKLAMRLLNDLSPRERTILTARFGLDGQKGQTFREIGDALGLSKERARVLAGRALERLQTLAQENGLTQPDDV